MEAKTLISPSHINIMKGAYQGLVVHCKEHGLDPKNMFLYHEGGELHVGFSDDKKTHITLNPIHWMPTHKA